MFLLNSRLGLFTAASFEAPLFPKLRGHFAEFLNKGYPARLRFLTSPTCVGLRYGHQISSFSSFSRQREFSSFDTCFLSPSHPSIECAYFTTHSASVLGRALPSTRSAYPSVSLHQSNANPVVLESQPVVHRLRHSPSA